MAKTLTVSDLRSVSEITAAGDAVLADLASEVYPLVKGWILDHVAAIPSHKASQRALPTDQDVSRLNMVRTAILLAHPVNG